MAMRRTAALGASLVVLLGMVAGLAAGTGPDKKSDWVPTSKADIATAPRITVEDLKKRIDAGEKVTILDSREPGGGAMIKGALSVPLERTVAWAKDVRKDAFVVCYCACPDDGAAARAVLELEEVGFTNAHALKGGIGAWAAAGLPTEDPATTQP